MSIFIFGYADTEDMQATDIFIDREEEEGKTLIWVFGQVAEMEEGMGEQAAALKQKEREVGKLQKECAAQRQAVKEIGNALKSAESTAQHARSAFVHVLCFIWLNRHCSAIEQAGHHNENVGWQRCPLNVVVISGGSVVLQHQQSAAVWKGRTFLQHSGDEAPSSITSSMSR